MRLSRRRLNRTLLRRQHLLARVDAAPADLVRHLVGLQAQEPMPPYLSLHARLTDLEPYDVTRALEDRSMVRLLTLRGTLHLHTAEDALALRPWTQPGIAKLVRNHGHADTDLLRAVVDDVLADGPIAQRVLSEALAARIGGLSASDLGALARAAVPLVQLPPRGTWGSGGGLVYDRLDRWVGRPLAEPDPEELVRRYLRAFGPAAPGDVSAWSSVTHLRPVVTRMADLVRHEDEDGRVLYDVPDAPIEDADAPAPVRLLGTYDNVWLSHAGRDRVTGPGTRTRWMGANGGVACTIFVDGWLEGLWRIEEGRVRVVDLFRTLTPRERAELDGEIARVEELLRS